MQINILIKKDFFYNIKVDFEANKSLNTTLKKQKYPKSIKKN